MPAVGQIGPDFALFNQEDHVIPLSRALNNADQVVIYFFPQPGAPGCTIEANGFRDIMPHLVARNVRVLGVTTGGPLAELRSFAKANNLNFDILYDGDRRISSEWGALRGEHAARVTFILNSKGYVSHAWTRVNVYNHAAEVLEAVGGPVEAGAAAPAAAAPAAAAPAAPAPVAAAPAPAAVPAAPAAAPVAAAPAESVLASAPADLIMATVRASLQLLLAYQRGGGAVPQDVVDLTAQIALAAQLARR